VVSLLPAGELTTRKNVAFSLLAGFVLVTTCNNQPSAKGIGTMAPRQTPRRAHAANRRTASIALGGILLLTLATLPVWAQGSAIPLSPPPLPPQPGLSSPSCTPPAAGSSAWTTMFESVVPASDSADLAAATAPVTVDPWVPCRMYRVSDPTTLQRTTDSGASWQTVFHDEAETFTTDVPPTLPSSPLPVAPPSESPLPVALPSLPVGLASASPTPQPSATPAAVQAGNPTQLIRASAPMPNTVFLAEAGNGDGAIASGDAGATWRLSDTGLEQQQVVRLTFAPSDASVAYAQLAAPHSYAKAVGPGTAGGPAVVTGLFVSHDGGRSWAPSAGDAGAASKSVPFQSSSTPPVAVDPYAPSHLWTIATAPPQVNVGCGDPSTPSPQDPAPGDQDLIESHDFGATWVDAGPLPEQHNYYGNSCVSFDTLIATTTGSSSAQRSVRIVAAVSEGYVGSGVWATDNDGRNWSGVALPGPALSQISAIADPWAPNRVVIAGIHRGAPNDPNDPSSVYVVASRDGLRSVQLAPPVAVTSGGGGNATFTAVGTFGAPDHHGDALQVDRAGRFYVGVVDFCAEAGPPACTPPKFVIGADRTRLLRLDIDNLASASTSGAPGTSNGGPANGSPGNTMPTLFSCQLPHVSGNLVDPPGASLAFDGQDILYVDYGEGPVVHKLRPYPVCADDGAITITFSPIPGLAGPPVIDQIAYDLNRNALWVTFDGSDGQPETNWHEQSAPPSGVAEVPLGLSTMGGASSATATGVVRWFVPQPNTCSATSSPCSPWWSCGWTYDWSTDTLLTCADRDGVHGARRVHPMDGTDVPSCLDRTTQTVGQNGWTIGSPGNLYIEGEDGGGNAGVDAMDAGACAVYRTYVHRPMGETTEEDDQLACDGVTFGQDSGFAVPNSVIWERDEATNNLSAFAIPDAFCPWPTSTQYRGPFLVRSGTTIDMCAALQQRGQGTPISGLPLDFQLDGRDVGQARTGTVAPGATCKPTLVNLPPGTYSVQVSFAGDHEYYSSEDSQTLTVWAPTGALQQGALPLLSGLLLPPPPPLPPGNVPEINPAPGAATQLSSAPGAAQEAQLQQLTQAQSQGQAQASTQLQPGLMMQRQRQEQVATQTSHQGPTLVQPMLASRRLASPSIVSVVEIATGTLMLGIALLRRRPALRIARIQGERRRARPSTRR
jgi:hypothetical protein